MIFEPALQQGTLVRRYKRFLVDVICETGAVTTMHCPNTGAMTGCAEPDSRVWYSTSGNPKRKYAHTLEIVETAAGEHIGINSAGANRLVAEALAEASIAELVGYAETQREARIPGATGRFDFRLSGSDLRSEGRADCFVEVKSVTLHVGAGQGLFPDAVSSRAERHVEALMRQVSSGARGVLLFCAQHSAIRRISCARDVHPEYADAVAEAMRAGVEVLAYRADVRPTGIALREPLPFTVG